MFWEQIKSNWVILIFTGSLIISWTNINSRLAQAQNDISQLSQVVQQINEINISLAVIQEKVTNVERLLKQ